MSDFDDFAAWQDAEDQVHDLLGDDVTDAGETRFFPGFKLDVGPAGESAPLGDGAPLPIALTPANRTALAVAIAAAIGTVTGSTYTTGEGTIDPAPAPGDPNLDLSDPLVNIWAALSDLADTDAVKLPDPSDTGHPVTVLLGNWPYTTDPGAAWSSDAGPVSWAALPPVSDGLMVLRFEPFETFVGWAWVGYPVAAFRAEVIPELSDLLDARARAKTTNAGVWIGTQAEYDLETPEVDAIYFVTSPLAKVYLGSTVLAVGTGDVVGQAASVDSEIALFSGTGGKTVKRATTTGLLKAAAGVLAAAVAGVDYAIPPGLGTGLGTTGTVNLDLAALDGTAQRISASGNITFTTSNLAAGRGVRIFVDAGGSSRTLAYPAWIAQGAALPTTLASGKRLALTLFSVGTTDADVSAAAAVQL